MHHPQPPPTPILASSLHPTAILRQTQRDCLFKHKKLKESSFLSSVGVTRDSSCADDRREEPRVPDRRPRPAGRQGDGAKTRGMARMGSGRTRGLPGTWWGEQMVKGSLTWSLGSPTKAAHAPLTISPLPGETDVSTSRSACERSRLKRKPPQCPSTEDKYLQGPSTQRVVRTPGEA